MEDCRDSFNKNMHNMILKYLQIRRVEQEHAVADETLRFLLYFGKAIQETPASGMVDFQTAC